MRRDYREDIDWLRAIAVLAAVAFHFEAPAVYGGFVGVDIFFVISGYLITGIIQSEVRSESFPSIFGVDSPLLPRSTRNPRIFPSSFAQTTAMSATGEFEIHILVPLSK